MSNAITITQATACSRRASETLVTMAVARRKAPTIIPAIIARNISKRWRAKWNQDTV
jgi:hypothetical protein